MKKTYEKIGPYELRPPLDDRGDLGWVMRKGDVWVPLTVDTRDTALLLIGMLIAGTPLSTVELFRNMFNRPKPRVLVTTAHLVRFGANLAELSAGADESAAARRREVAAFEVGAAEGQANCGCGRPRGHAGVEEIFVDGTPESGFTQQAANPSTHSADPTARDRQHLEMLRQDRQLPTCSQRHPGDEVIQ